ATLTGLGPLPPPAILTSTQPKPPRPAAKLAHTALVAGRGGVIAVELTCPAAAVKCVGTITLRVSGAPRSGSGRPMLITLAAGSFSVAGGRVKTIRVRLSRQARGLLARRHVLRATVGILAKDPAGVTY